MYMMPKGDPSSPDYIEQEQFAKQNRIKFIYRAIGKVTTIASAVYRHRIGRGMSSG